MTTTDTTRIAAVAMHSAMGDYAANLIAVEAWCPGGRTIAYPQLTGDSTSITSSISPSTLPAASLAHHPVLAVT